MKMSRTSLIVSSAVVRLAWLQTQVAPQLKFSPHLSILAALAYLSSLPKWLQTILNNNEVRRVQVREVEVSPTRHREYPVKRIKQEIEVPDGEGRGRKRRRPSVLETSLIGGPSPIPKRNILSLALNTVLILWLLDQNWSSRLFLQSRNLSYARVSELSPSSASINLRLPSSGNHAIARIAYRPLLAAELRSEESPRSWELSQPVRVSREDDWTSTVTLEGLHPALQYEYQIRADQPGEAAPLSLNFTTFPDPRLSKRSTFRFIHAGSPHYYPMRQNPFSALPSLLPLSYPITTPTPSHVFHQWKRNHLRQPGWKQLGDWLADIRYHSAWTQVEFALIGAGIESIGPKYKPMSLRSGREHLRARQIMASQDTREVYETLPILSASPRSPSQGPVVEPGAVSTQSTTFQYGGAAFYRLRGPFQEMGQEDSVDWLNDTRDLKQWLARNEDITGFNFVTTPISLAPWLGGRRHLKAWREAVLDALGASPNVIVLAESKYGFSATQLGKTVIEIASPPLTSKPGLMPWSRTIRLPSKIRKEIQVLNEAKASPTHYLIKFLHNSGAAKWTSIEIDTTSSVPRALISAIENGETEWTMEYVGVSPRAGSRALGGLAEGFTNMLRRLGLLGSRRWV